ncbi:MAG TPA: hypothetical protein VGE09_11280 [Pseudoxanthomonas sp.]
MKIITSVTVRVKGKGDEHEYIAPGEHDLPDDVAKDLLKRGHAKTPAAAAKDAEPAPGPSVTKAAAKAK